MKRFHAVMLANIACLFLAATAWGNQNCLQFDGVNDYVAVPHNSALALTNQATFETWIKPSSSTAIRVICSKMNYWGNPNGYLFMMWGMGMRLMWGNGNTDYIDVFSSSVIPADAWTHVAVTYEGTTVKWYLDGVLNRTSTVSSVTIAASSDSLLFGRANNDASSGYWFNGSLDRLRIWNYARSIEQILASKNAVVDPGTSGLVAQYTYNQGVAGGNNSGITTLYDSSGMYGKSSPVDGSLRNFALSGSSSNWVVSGAPSAVELTQFDAFGLPGTVRLAWSTASELNTAFWIVERSLASDAGYAEIGRLPAAGNAATGADYSFTDGRAGPGIAYFYRIAEMELGGAVTYYGPVQATAGLASMPQARTIEAWPNPFGSVVGINATPYTAVRIYDLTGRLVRELDSGSGQLAWDGKDRNGMSLGPGVYFVRSEGSSGISTARIIKLQ